MAVDLHPLPLRHKPVRRFTQLLLGLVLFGVSVAMQVRATLGLNPWDVLHEGLTKQTPLSFGTASAITGLAVLALWLPLRQRPGIGTVLNVVVISGTVDIALAVMPSPTSLPVRAALLISGIVANGLGTAAYIGTRLGPGPRDGLMTGLAARTRWSLRLVRTAIEVTVLAGGFLLGGTVGIGTVLFAVSIGPLTQAFLRWFVVPNQDSAVGSGFDQRSERR